jgi:NAD(P)-dependent dehydrogenase (short-subunit alcohol dehydrogenase family)
VIGVGRTESSLVEVQRSIGSNFQYVVADVATDEREKIVEAVRARGRLALLVHNAAVLRPETSLEKVTPEEWRSVMSINAEAPLFLTQALLPHLDDGARVLHISSGAAHKALSGAASYCVSKAALYSLWQCMKMELGPRGIHFGSVRPGVVESRMQHTLRDFSGAVGSKFAELHAHMEEDRPVQASAPPSGALDTPTNVAHFLGWLLLEVGAEEFSREEWDIRDEHHHARWAGHME